LRANGSACEEEEDDGDDARHIAKKSEGEREGRGKKITEGAMGTEGN
jgi:hypothetical protein